MQWRLMANTLYYIHLLILSSISILINNTLYTEMKFPLYFFFPIVLLSVSAGHGFLHRHSVAVQPPGHDLAVDVCATAGDG